MQKYRYYIGTCSLTGHDTVILNTPNRIPPRPEAGLSVVRERVTQKKQSE